MGEQVALLQPPVASRVWRQALSQERWDAAASKHGELGGCESQAAQPVSCVSYKGGRYNTATASGHRFLWSETSENTFIFLGLEKKKAATEATEKGGMGRGDYPQEQGKLNMG